VFHSVENTACCIDEDGSVLSVVKLAEWTSWADAIAKVGVDAVEALEGKLFVAIRINIGGGRLLCDF
jgi:hypothetical protein